jgi:hypothetical protein
MQKFTFLLTLLIYWLSFFKMLLVMIIITKKHFLIQILINHETVQIPF